jgi:class 3 adenylate cyclase
LKSAKPIVNLTERVAMLRKVSIFDQTDEAVLAEIAEAMSEASLRPEETIFHKGDEGRDMYVIAEGAVRVHDEAYVFAVLREGQVFGEYSLLEPVVNKRSASVTAIVKTRLLLLAQDVFYKMMSNRIEIVKGILSVLIKRARRQNYFEEKLSEQSKELERQRDLINQEKEKSDKLLLNILPVDVADELKTKGRADVRSYAMTSVLFCDIKGFTSASETLSPEEVVQALEVFFTAFDEIIARNNIEKIKTIGDAYMCVGGIPKENKTNPVDLTLAALEMQRFVADFLKNPDNQHLPRWQLRLGIHSGALIAGVIGKKKFAYDVWGDTVNTASRMESSGEVNRVNVSGTMYKLIKDFFVCEHRGKINAKGKGKVDMYFVNSIRPELSQQGLGILPNDAFKQKLAEQGN